MLIWTSPLHLVAATRFACYRDRYPMTFVWWSGGATSTHISMLQGWGWNGTYPCSFLPHSRLDRQRELYQKGSQINNPSATGDRKRKTYTVHAPHSFVSTNACFTRVDCLLEPVRMSVRLRQIQRLMRYSYWDKGILLCSKLCLCCWGEICWAILV